MGILLPYAQVIEIGPKLGHYTLIGAWWGRYVVVVEERLTVLQQMHHYVMKNNFQSQILLLHNIVSDNRVADGVATARITVTDSGNQLNLRPGFPKTMTLSDLLEVVSFQDVILKISNGNELNVLKKAEELFLKIRIVFVLLEWDNLRKLPIVITEPLIGWFESRGYQACWNDGVYVTALKPEQWQSWPDEIAFWLRI